MTTDLKSQPTRIAVLNDLNSNLRDAWIGVEAERSRKKNFLAYGALSARTFSFHEWSLTINQRPQISADGISTFRSTHILDCRDSELLERMAAIRSTKGETHA